MADHLMYSDPAPDNASDESSVNFSPREGPGIVLDAPRHRNTTNTCQPEQTDLKPSFTHPHGSAQVINLRNRPGKYGKTGTRSHKNARPKVPNGKYSVSMAQMESYFRTELGWTLIKRMTDNTSASNGFQERNADFSVGFQTDERGEIPIDPVLLEYDRQVQLNLINPGNKDYCSDSPTLPPSRVHVSLRSDAKKFKN